MRSIMATAALILLAPAICRAQASHADDVEIIKTPDVKPAADAKTPERKNPAGGRFVRIDSEDTALITQGQGPEDSQTLAAHDRATLAWPAALGQILRRRREVERRIQGRHRPASAAVDCGEAVRSPAACRALALDSTAADQSRRFAARCHHRRSPPRPCVRRERAAHARTHDAGVSPWTRDLSFHAARPSGSFPTGQWQ